MKKTILASLIIIMVCLTACGKSVCSAENCKNDAVENGLCEAHAKLQNNETISEESNNDEEVEATVNPTEDQSDSDYEAYFIEDLIYAVPGNWKLVDLSTTNVTWKEDTSTDAGYLNLKYHEFDTSSITADIDSYAKQMYEAYTEDEDITGISYETLDVSGCPSMEMKVQSKSRNEDATILAIYTDKGYYTITAAKQIGEYSDFDMHYGFIKASMTIVSGASDFADSPEYDN